MGLFQENDIGHFGIIDGTVDSYKQAAEYAEEAKCWAQKAKDGVGDLTELINQMNQLIIKIDGYQRQADMVFSYPELKAYIGPYKVVLMTRKEHQGLWQLNEGTRVPDNKVDGVMIVNADDGRQWFRSVNDGVFNIDWWYRDTDVDDYSLTITRASDWTAVNGQEWWQMLIPTTPAGLCFRGPGGTRKCKTQAKIKMWKVDWDFNGMFLDFRESPTLNLECMRVEYATFSPRLSNLRLVGSRDEGRDMSGLCVFYPTASLFGMATNQVHVSDLVVENFAKGVVFGENSYIQKWDSIILRHCDICIWTRRTVDSEGNVTFQTGNAGEKIVFYKSLLADSRQAMDVAHNIWFDNTSFDYIGFGTHIAQLANQDSGIFVIRNTYVDFFKCHFEWGNANSRNARPVFRTYNGGGFYITDGTWHSVGTFLSNKTDTNYRPPADHPEWKNDTTRYQILDYFHFDETPDLSGFGYIDGWKLINADINKGWTNSTKFEMKNIIAPGHVNMYREMYLGDNVSALGEPTWSDKFAINLNNVYFGNTTASGTGVNTEFATMLPPVSSDNLSVVAVPETATEKGGFIVTTKTPASTDKIIHILIPAKPRDFCTASIRFSGLTGATTSGAMTVGMQYGKYIVTDDGAHIVTTKGQSWPTSSSVITLDATHPEGTAGIRRISAVNDAPRGQPIHRPAEYLPTSGNYTNYIKLAINVSNLVGTASSPASVKIQPLIQKIENIYDRNPNGSS